MSRGQPIKTWSTPIAPEGRELVPCALCAGRRFRPRLSCEGFAYVRCARCGLVQMNPQPLAGDVGRRYRESFGQDYLSYELANEAVFLGLQQLALEDAGFYRIERELLETTSSPPTVLDVGCATGALLAVLRDRGWQVTGVEISPSGDYARLNRNIPVQSASLEECHFPDGSFDLAHASHLIEHLNNPASFIGEAWRVLRPGARLLLTTPNIDGFQARLFGSRWRSAIFDHLYLFSRRTLAAMLRAAGFIVEGVYTWGGLAAGTAPAPVKACADRAAKLLGIGDVMLVKARKASK